MIECYSKAITHLGPAGSGQLTKMVNQICIAGLVEALAEGLLFAEAAGLDARLLRRLACGAVGGRLRSDNRELLAAVPCARIAVAHMPANQLAELAQAQVQGAQATMVFNWGHTPAHVLLVEEDSEESVAANAPDGSP